MTTEPQPIEGPYARCRHIPVVDPTIPAARVLITDWLIDAPSYHPAWNQYVLFVIRLCEDPGFPPAKLRVPGATHELDILALDPREGTYDVEDVQIHEHDGMLPALNPPSVSAQVVCTDGEAAQLATYALSAIAHGRLSPEPPFGHATHWATWQHALETTLEHIRDPRAHETEGGTP